MIVVLPPEPLKSILTKKARSAPRLFQFQTLLMGCASCTECCLQIRFCRSDRADVEVLHQEVEDVGGEVGRQGGPELDVLDSQVQERKEDDMGLLLVP